MVTPGPLLAANGHVMNKVFLINETIIFEPELRRLGPLASYPDRALTLHGPVNECLTQLLDHNGEVLTQRYLFSAVWEKQGAVVTTNALYQTISSIRKALKTAGLDDDVIKTLPKAGFKCIARVIAGERDDFLKPQKISAAPVLIAPSTEQTEVFVKVATTSPTRFWPYWIAALLFILSCNVFYQTWKYDEPVFARYHPVGQLNGCNVFSSWYDRDKSQSAFEALSDRYTFRCHEGETAYLTLNHAQRGVTVLICDNNPQESATRCRSIYYKQQYNENE